MSYQLPAGIISQSTDHAGMHGDFIKWMERQDGLYDVMNNVASGIGLLHKEGWSERDYIQREAVDDSAYAVSIFDIMADLTPLLPEGHVFGFSEGRIGIFECDIKIVEIKEEPAYDEETLKTLQAISRLMDQIRPLVETMRELSGATILRLGQQIPETDKFFLQAARDLSNMQTRDGSGLDFIHRQLCGEINHRVNVNNGMTVYKG